jgi:hypothetical protein
MLFALTDQTNVIAVNHINAAMAWVRYWVESVKFIFQSAVDEAGAAATTDMAQRIVTYLATHGQATRTDLTKGCFGGHVSKATLDKALDELITASPPAIEVETVPRPNGQPGSPSKVYKPCAPPAQPARAANSANSAEREAPWASAAGFGATRNVRNLLNVERNEGAAKTQKLPEVAQFAESASRQSTALTPMDIDTSQDSHSSQAQTGNTSADDVEVF